MKKTLSLPATWLQATALYQIYPRSFYDSNNDGIGDLPGITQKLDYLKGGPDSLGVDAIWLSPFYPSPMKDFGYDVSDYCNVDPVFGSLEDFDTLLREAHKREIKVLLDFVPNHTSDQHPWFVQSRSNKDSPKREWYTWHDPAADGGPPNNWLSAFGGTAWEFDESSKQYYLHTFLSSQPDLNWHNPEVRTAMKQVMRFWLDRGVDGFRIDAVFWLAKDALLRDDPSNPDFDKHAQTPYDSLRHLHSRGQPHIFDYLKELAITAKHYGDRLLITEAYPDQRAAYQQYLDFYKKVDPTVLVPFNFEGIFLPWDARAFKASIDAFQTRLHTSYMPVYAFGNHDSPRIVARYGKAAARTLAMLSMTLPGLPLIYYGDELGMDNVPIDANHQRDYRDMPPGYPPTRDPQRTPMLWSAEKNGGFSQADPWLPVGSVGGNALAGLRDQTSLLSLYRQLLAIRGLSKTLQMGSYSPVATQPDLFAYRRQYGQETLGVVLNFSASAKIAPPFVGEVVASTVSSPGAELLPYEGRLVRL